MRKKYTLAVVSALALTLTGCLNAGAITPKSVAKMDFKKVCSVEANGIEKVIASAKKYNAVAIKEKVEFRRLGVNNSSLITSVEEGIKAKAKSVQPMTVKKKKFKPALDINFAAERACKFAMSALVYKHEAETTYKAAIPGDGFKY